MKEIIKQKLSIEVIPIKETYFIREVNNNLLSINEIYGCKGDLGCCQDLGCCSNNGCCGNKE